MRPSALRLGLALVLVLAAGCAERAARFSDRAMSLGFRPALVDGEGFRHITFRRGESASRAPGALHVYLDGDGTPWEAGRPAVDPTPRDPLVLRLMALDPAPSVYLGRPCYHGLAAEPSCAPALWTDARYSEAVVVSLAAAARRILAEEGRSSVVWLGYSGGGTLAVLVAARVRETAGVVTLAANLDVDGWTRLHAQPPLTASLNPARRPPLSPGIYQRHYAGERDGVVPPSVVAAGGVPSGSLRVMPRYDHACCWTELWPDALAEFGRAVEGRP
jgi:hypothetical protein